MSRPGTATRADGLSASTALKTWTVRPWWNGKSWSNSQSMKKQRSPERHCSLSHTRRVAGFVSAEGGPAGKVRSSRAVLHLRNQRTL